MSRKHKKKLENCKACVEYHKIYYIQKAKSDNEGKTFLPGKELEQNKKKRMIPKLIPDLLSCPTHLCASQLQKEVVEKEKIPHVFHSTCMITLMHTQLRPV